MDVRPRGNPDAKILVVGEAPGEQEQRAGVPFVGASGKELINMLREAGISEDDCRFTNMVNTRPPNNKIDEFFYSSKKKSEAGDGTYHRGRYVRPIIFDGLSELEGEIKQTKPNVVLALGNNGLWAATGEYGITKWRGSEMMSSHFGVKVVPTYHPAGVLRNYEWRFIAVQDLRRLRREMETDYVTIPDYDFILSPSASGVLHHIDMLMHRVRAGPTKIACDIETRNRQIACIGLAWDNLSALCIPIQSVEDDNGSYFTPAEEVEVIWALRSLLCHPNCHVIGQNFVYDNQYFAKNYGFACNLTDDTMLQQGVAFPGLPKGLDFISSMYREHHLYWKDDGKLWDPKHTNELQLWRYNCIDAVATYECHAELSKVLDHYSLQGQYREKMETGRNAFRMMLRGVKSNEVAKTKLSSELAIAIAQHRKWLMDVVNYDVFGPKGISAQKMMHLVYKIMNLPRKFRVVKGARFLTANKEALAEWLDSPKVEPLFKPILQAIKDTRSMQVFKSTFADQPLDVDGRFRCSYNVVGAHTMRWNSSEDAFGFGGNLQNIPKGDDR